MTIVGALFGCLVFGASGYFAGYRMGVSKWVDEVEDRQTAATQNTAAARNSRNVLDFKERAMTFRAIRQSAIGLRHANLTRDLLTKPSAFEPLGTVRAKSDPLADIERDLRETEGAIADLAEQVAQGGEAKKYAGGFLKLMTKRHDDLMHRLLPLALETIR
jgi:hypothetical protein